MSHPATLGGRLPLVDRESLSPAQKALFDHMVENVVPWADSVGFVARTDAGEFIGPFNPALLNPAIGPFNPALLNPAIGSAFLGLQSTEESHTSLSQRIRQVVILTVGAAWQAPYELYAHSAAGRSAGLSQDAVHTLAAGGLAQDLTEAEALAHRLARALSVEHRLPDALYSQAEATFGAEGVFDIVVLVGSYHTVCAILNAFAIPAASRTHT